MLRENMYDPVIVHLSVESAFMLPTQSYFSEVSIPEGLTPPHRGARYGARHSTTMHEAKPIVRQEAEAVPSDSAKAHSFARCGASTQR
jgi:hypothetical protein